MVKVKRLERQLEFMEEHRVRLIDGKEVFFNFVTSEWANELALEAGLKRFKLGDHIVIELPRGYLVFVGAASDPQGFSCAHIHIPVKPVGHSAIKKLADEILDECKRMTELVEKIIKE